MRDDVVANNMQIWYNHQMRRHRTALAIIVVCFAVMLYREWIIRTRPPLFLPLGFFESVNLAQSPEEGAREPASWADPVKHVVFENAEFSERAAQLGARNVSVGVLVAGPTLGGFAAAVSAADEGVATMLVASGDWKPSILADAAEYVSKQNSPQGLGTELERDLQRFIDSRRQEEHVGDANGSPSTVVAFFEERMAKTTHLDVLTDYTIVGFARDEEGRLNRALLRSSRGDDSILAQFHYMIDGTRDGSVLALSSTPTTSSWDNGPDDPDAAVFPPASLAALTEGYSMSGYTVHGLGKRLENASMHVDVIDNGFHGTFVPVIDADPCWAKDAGKTSFMNTGSTVLRTRTIGCAARMTVRSSFEDTVELFLINHGNDAVSGEISFGNATTLRLSQTNDHAAQLTKIGAFPVGPDSPINVTIRSILPTDRIEGLIVRKLNTASLGKRVGLNGTAPGRFTTNDWSITTYDAYVTASNDDIDTFAIDGKPYDIERIGDGTYLAKDLSLRAGSHEIVIPKGEGHQVLTLIPVRPGDAPLPLALDDQAPVPTWSILPDRDVDVFISVPATGCPTDCRYMLTENESKRVELHSDSVAGAELLGSTVPLGKVSLLAGKTYVFTTNEGYDIRMPPLLVPLEDASVLYAIGKNPIVQPTRAGMVYDVWIRPVRPSESIATFGSVRRTMESASRWQHAGTEPLSTLGAKAEASGTIEIVAIPNTSLDSYHLPLDARPSPDALLTDLPAGAYSIASFGVQNPMIITMKNPVGSTQSFTFKSEGGAYHALEKYVHTGESNVSHSAPWPQRLVLYERINRPGNAAVAIRDASLLVLDSQAKRPSSRNARGTLLFEARQTGIGPITLSAVGSQPMNQRVREETEDAFLLLRTGKTNVRMDDDCDATQDPRCDMRRYVRHVSTLETDDDVTSRVTYPEGRRLLGSDILALSDAYATRANCTSCREECVPLTMSGSTCIIAEAFAIPREAILSVRGTDDITDVVSPKESLLGTLASLFRALRRDQLLGAEKTYLEETPPARDVTLTLGMFMAEGMETVLAGSTTVSATAGAAKTLRTPTTELAIGSVAGHMAAFSLRHEYAPLWFITQSPGAVERLQRHLIARGVRVTAAEGRDPLETKALQARTLDGRTSLVPTWENGRVTFTTTPMTSVEKENVFEGENVRTVGEALRRLPGTPTDATNANILQFGLDSGFLTEKFLNLSFAEIMDLPLDESFLLKAEYLLSSD